MPPASRAKRNHTITAASAHSVAVEKKRRGAGKKQTNIAGLSRQGSRRYDEADDKVQAASGAN